MLDRPGHRLRRGLAAQVDTVAGHEGTADGTLDLEQLGVGGAADGVSIDVMRDVDPHLDPDRAARVDAGVVA